MLAWLYDLFLSFVTFVLGLFGFDLKKKSVSFADDVKDTPTDSATPIVTAAATVVENVLVAIAETKDEAAPATESA